MYEFAKHSPRREAILVPFFCDIAVGEPIDSELSRKEFMEQLDQSMEAFSAELSEDEWE